MKNTVLLMATALVLVSCGEDNITPDSAPNGPFTASHANQIIQGIKMKSPEYRPGQEKMIYQSMEKEIAGNIVCDYWDDRTITVLDVGQTHVELETTSETKLMENEPPSCPQEATPLSRRSKKFTKAEYEQKTTEFIRYYIDHNYRCKQNNACSSSKFVRSEDQILKGVPVKMIVTEYNYKSGDVGVLKSWVSTRSLFEGVLAYEMEDKKTKSTWFKRGFISSHQ